MITCEQDLQTSVAAESNKKDEINPPKFMNYIKWQRISHFSKHKKRMIDIKLYISHCTSYSKNAAYSGKLRVTAVIRNDKIRQVSQEESNMLFNRYEYSVCPKKVTESIHGLLQPKHEEGKPVSRRGGVIVCRKKFYIGIRNSKKKKNGSIHTHINLNH